MARLRVSRYGTVTQATNKSTGVTIGADSGTITMNNASLGATTSVNFTVTNGYVDANDTVVLSIASGATASSYLLSVDAVTNGTFVVHLRNLTAGALAEAVVINFSVIKNA